MVRKVLFFLIDVVPEASIVAARPVVREGAGGRPHGGVRRVHRRDRHVGASHGGVEGVEGG